MSSRIAKAERWECPPARRSGLRVPPLPTRPKTRPSGGRQRTRAAAALSLVRRQAAARGPTRRAAAAAVAATPVRRTPGHGAMSRRTRTRRRGGRLHRRGGRHALAPIHMTGGTSTRAHTTTSTTTPVTRRSVDGSHACEAAAPVHGAAAASGTAASVASGTAGTATTTASTAGA